MSVDCRHAEFLASVRAVSDRGRLFDPSRPGVEAVETHVSTVVFDGDLVHKRKKPVRFPFVDLSTPERRARCATGRSSSTGASVPTSTSASRTSSTTRDRGRPRRADAANACRPPAGDAGAGASRRLRLHGGRGSGDGGLPRQGACTSDEISSVATPAALHDLWDAEPRELAPFVAHPLDPRRSPGSGELAHRYLDGRATLLVERIASGRIVDGHGDLLADDIFCLDDGPRILDCLEFDDRLRWGDVLYDVGFLAMDLERLGRPDLALAFLDWYREYSGETHPPSLEHLYIAYRALVRAKISCLRAGADDEAERAPTSPSANATCWPPACNSS